MSEAWKKPERACCCCGCGRLIEDEGVHRIEGASVEGIPIVLVYATEQCAERGPRG